MRTKIKPLFYSLAGILLLQFILLGSYGTVTPARAADPTPQQLYESARKSYYELITSPARKAYRQNWMNAIHGFRKVVSLHPESYESYKAAFTLGRLYQDLGDISGLDADREHAAGYFESVVKRFPVNRLTDDALLHLAEVHLSLKKREMAVPILEKIVGEYPKGDQVGAARKLLTTLKLESAPSNSQEAEVKPARLYDLGYENGGTRAQITLNAKGNVTFARKEGPDNQLAWVFRNAQWDSTVPENLDLPDGLIKRLQMVRDASGNAQLEVSLTEGRKVEVKSKLEGAGLVLDFTGNPLAQDSKPPVSVTPVLPIAKTLNPNPEPKPEEKPTPQAPPVKEAKKESTPVVQSKKPDREKGELLIVLDPGHGGKDDGAKGRTGLLEKDLNLQIANRVQKILLKRYKIKSVLTRTDDTFIELKERGDMANRLEADLFVSIHANAAPRRSAQGIETYFLGSGSSDRALETAARENGELVESVEDDEVQQILASLISTTKINESGRLAADVQRRLAKLMGKKFSKVNDLGVKEGPFFVLHRTNMPSILVEVGFVTNRHEERRLKQNSYQYWLAESIAQGIHRFLKDKAPSI